ncbi:hypothetical protein AB0L99_24470 [Streptomyces sp. NPDC051954]|uniref:hypothetical protein n=1 Tax=Streptomyces sp. NPDC051954 TaxID=3155524 RepID=UPI0034419F8B
MVSPTTGKVAWVIVDTATYELHPAGTTFARAHHPEIGTVPLPRPPLVQELRHLTTLR